MVRSPALSCRLARLHAFPVMYCVNLRHALAYTHVGTITSAKCKAIESLFRYACVVPHLVIPWLVTSILWQPPCLVQDVLITLLRAVAIDIPHNTQRLLQKTAISSRSLMQSDNVQCLAFVPFQASDYEYIRTLSNERRRESFAISRERGQDTSGAVSADAPWSFESLNGTPNEGGRQALTAFPKMNKRSFDLFSAFFIASVEDETGVDINDSVGKSTKQPYYFVQSVCNGNCQELTPAERAAVDANARSSRAVVSCVDKVQLAQDPFAIALPFTPGPFTPAVKLTCTAYPKTPGIFDFSYPGKVYR